MYATSGQEWFFTRAASYGLKFLKYELNYEENH